MSIHSINDNIWMKFVELALFFANVTYEHKILNGTCSCLFYAIISANGEVCSIKHY